MKNVFESKFITLITYKTKKSKMHVEPNELILNEQHFVNLKCGMYEWLRGRTSRKKDQKIQKLKISGHGLQ